MAIRVGINGFGRIGRNFFRAAKGNRAIDVVAVNDITDAGTLAHLLKYDSVMGPLGGDVKAESNGINVDGKQLQVISQRDPAELPWGDLGVDVVIESTGIFTKRDLAAKHLAAGAKKVVISAPAGDADISIVMGVNHQQYSADKHDVISNASCTTNCLAPMVKVILNNFGVNHGLMTTIHSYTNDQKVLDLPHKDLRRARAAGLSMIPTTTGAAKAVGLVLPELAGKLDGMAIRVPTPNVSVVDAVLELGKAATVDQINEAYDVASDGVLRGILQVCHEPLVSIDFNQNPHSCIIDAASTSVMNGNLVKVLGWYDNEWGYSMRLVDLIQHMHK